MTEQSSYTRTAIGLHWLIFLLIAGALTVGWVMTDLEFSPLKVKLFNYHKWIGVSVLLLALIRILWKLTHKAPPLLPMARWQTIASHAVHGLLYLLMVAMPLSGYLYSNASGYSIVWFGKIPLPDLIGKNKALEPQLEELHATLGIILAVLVGLHILAALKHHYVDKDTTMRRMLPFLKG